MIPVHRLMSARLFSVAWKARKNSDNQKCPRPVRGLHAALYRVPWHGESSKFSQLGRGNVFVALHLWLADGSQHIPARGGNQVRWSVYIRWGINKRLFQIPRLQVDRFFGVYNIHAFRGGPTLSGNIHAYSQWPGRGFGRCSVVVRQVHIPDYCSRSVQCN